MMNAGNSGKKDYSAQLKKELEDRQLRTVRDYIEKQVVLSVPEYLEIDTVILTDGTRIPGKDIRHCFEEMMLAVNNSGEMTYIPYTSIVKVLSTDKT